MLTLSRKLYEEIEIGSGPDAVTIMVTSIDRGKVRLAFKAPRSVPIHRKEIADRIRQEQHDAERSPH